MKYSILLILLWLFIGCKDNSMLDAQKVVDKAIAKAGGDRFYGSKIEFDFRDKTYCAVRTEDDFRLERQIFEDSVVTTDILSNSYFLRLRNEKQVLLADSTRTKLSNAINSVHYFSVLPYGLNDPAANKAYLGKVSIKGKEYHKIKVYFDEKGGGTDFEDVFIYWISTKSYHVDYLAYEFHVDGGGMRFREAYNQRYVNGIRFVDYRNYKPRDVSYKISEMDRAFEDSELELLSNIELENVKVEECSRC